MSEKSTKSAPIKSMERRGSEFADTSAQLRVLNNHRDRITALPKFASKLKESGLWPLRPTSIDILQMNVGYMCNQTCKHCHVDAGPDRTEIMTRETMNHCLDVIRGGGISTVDLTGGAPEMNPDFRWFVEQASPHVDRIIVRCNLTIINANPKYNDLPQFFALHEINVVSSLPYYNKRNTDRQRGDGVFDSSIKALLALNEVGYGKEGSGLELDLVYNPVGAFLPAPQKSLEADYKRELKRLFNVEFNSLFTITNMPIARYLEYLIASGNYEAYMEKLVNSYNPAAAAAVMCRNTLSVGWDGVLYDCDFNQMLDLEVGGGAPRHIKDFDRTALTERAIIVNQHCYGCTAGAGSSCGGEVA